MKRIVCMLLCFCLMGCSKITGSLQNRLNTALSEAERAPVNAPNNRKTFYSYYLDPSLGRIYSTETGNVFSRGGRSFVMNLDIASIINDKYYPGQDNPHAFALSGKKIAERTGLLDLLGHFLFPYSLQIIQLVLQFLQTLAAHPVAAVH